MSSFPVSLNTEQALEKRMTQLSILESDIEEHFVRSSGPGGQKVNKTSSCVVLKHIPSGLEVKCQITRSQALNRFHARKLLCEKLESIIEGKKSAEEQKREKIRRQKRKRSKRAKEKVLQTKHHRTEVKRGRKKIMGED